MKHISVTAVAHAKLKMLSKRTGIKMEQLGTMAVLRGLEFIEAETVELTKINNKKEEK